MTVNRRSRTLYGSSREDLSDGLATKIDEVGGGVTYVGKAETGAQTSDPVWRIFKVTELAGNTDVEYADGNDYYDNIWDNRAALSYS